ncbi:MAG: hypothetical protein ACO3DD_00945 [Burkholderiaceae bacterium]
MIDVEDSIQSSGHPLAFCVHRQSDRPGLFAGAPDVACLKVEARALGAHQKEAVISEGTDGPRWRVVSDEGPQLKGSDLAPFPLGFFNAGLQADLLGAIDRVNLSRGSPLSSVSQTLINRYAFSGSFYAGTGQGEAAPAEIEIVSQGNCSAKVAALLIHDAVRQSCALAAMTSPLDCTFALYVNGIRREVTGAKSSEAPDAYDPLKSRAGPPQPVSDGQNVTNLIAKTSDYVPPNEAMPSASTRFGLEVLGRSVLTLGKGQTAIQTTLKAPPGSEFSFLSQENAVTGPTAPSGLALVSAGIAFCYMTQLLRYAEYLKYKVRAIRLVQFNPFGLQVGAEGSLDGQALPVDTHLFLHGAEYDTVMQRLLAISANTCYLHAALRSALPARVAVTHNGERQVVC